MTPNLWKLADNPEDMRKKSVEEIEKIIKPCGLAPRKAKAIHRLSEMICDEHDGEVPAEPAIIVKAAQ